MTEKGEKAKGQDERSVGQSELMDLLFTLMEEMDQHAREVVRIAETKFDDEAGARNLMVIGGVVGLLAECLKVTLDKSK